MRQFLLAREALVTHSAPVHCACALTPETAWGKTHLVCILLLEYIQVYGRAKARKNGAVLWGGNMADKLAVLFVCLGNICRSPLAEAAFRRELKAVALEAEADSAGTGDWHIGEAPDRRAQAVAKRNGIDISGYRARLVSLEDFQQFSHIVALDRKNEQFSKQ